MNSSLILVQKSSIDHSLSTKQEEGDDVEPPDKKRPENLRHHRHHHRHHHHGHTKSEDSSEDAHSIVDKSEHRRHRKHHHHHKKKEVLPNFSESSETEKNNKKESPKIRELKSILSTRSKSEIISTNRDEFSYTVKKVSFSVPCTPTQSELNSNSNPLYNFVSKKQHMEEHHLYPIISPSLLSADLSDLANEAVRMVEAGADWLHLDVMDGHFVNNLTFGPPVLKSLIARVSKTHDVFWDCHLMVSEPEKWVEPMKEAGVDLFTFHYEATTDPLSLIKQVKQAGMKVGIALKPHGSREHLPIEQVLGEQLLDGTIDYLLIMTVQPGFGGQDLIPAVLFSIRSYRIKYPDLMIGVDGGINRRNVATVASMGANVVVSGSGIFKEFDPPSLVISEMRDKITENFDGCFRGFYRNLFPNN